MELTKKCPECNGEGWVYNEAWDHFDHETMDPRMFIRRHGLEDVECRRCHGTGETLTEEGNKVAQIAQMIVDGELEAHLKHHHREKSR